MVRLIVLLATAVALVFSPSGSTLSFSTTASIEGSAIQINGKPFFPIITWAQCAPEVEESLALDINVFMGSSCSEEELVKAIGGRAYFVADYGIGDNLASYPNLIGYYLPDEPDGRRIRPDELPRTKRVTETGKLVFQNFTANFTTGETPDDYAAYISNIDVASFDLYPLAHYCEKIWVSLSSVYDYQRRLARLADGKPTYQWIEVNSLEGFCGPNPVNQAIVRAEAWLAIAGGATSLGYFTHGWPEGHWEKFYVAPDIAAAVAATNEEVRVLAPMLLGTQIPAIYSGFKDPVKVGGRSYQGRIYVVAVNATERTVSWSRQLPSLRNQLVSIYGEERKLRAKNGQLTGKLEPYQVCIYSWPHRNQPLRENSK